MDVEEAEKIMNEVHVGVYGPCMNRYILTKKILRAGYYFLTIEQDYFHFMKKCHQFPIPGDLIQSAPLELHSMIALSQNLLMAIYSFWSQSITLPHGWK